MHLRARALKGAAETLSSELLLAPSVLEDIKLQASYHMFLCAFHRLRQLSFRATQPCFSSVYEMAFTLLPAERCPYTTPCNDTLQGPVELTPI